MASVLDSFLHAQQDAVRAALNERNAFANRQATRTVTSAANRGSANPMATGAAVANALAAQRGANASAEAGMLAQAHLADQNRTAQLVGSLLNTAGSIGGMMIGGPAGSQIGSTGGNLAGSFVSKAMAPKQPSVSQATSYLMPQHPAAQLGNPGTAQSAQAPLVAAPQPAPSPAAPQAVPAGPQMAQLPAPPAHPSSASIMSQLGAPAASPGAPLAERNNLTLPFLPGLQARPGAAAGGVDPQSAMAQWLSMFGGG